MLAGIFAICIVVLVIGSIAWAHHLWDDFGAASGIGILVFFASVIGFGIALAVVVSNNIGSFKAVDTEKTTLSLRALANTSNIDGRLYFLGGGYIGEQQVINYITQTGNGAIRLDSMPAAQATIFEDSNTPHLNIIKTVRYMPDVVPWELGSTMHYDFHIPAGSVLENYKVDVAK